jgi:hypothetical protein
MLRIALRLEIECGIERELKETLERNTACLVFL